MFDNLTGGSNAGWARAGYFSRDRVPHKYRWAWDGLVLAMPGWLQAGGIIDLVDGLVGTINGTMTQRPGPTGTEMQFAASSYISLGDATKFATPLNGNVTFLCIHEPLDVSARDSIWRYCGVGGKRTPFAVVFSNAGSSQYAFWNDYSANGCTTTTTYAVGTRNLVIGRRIGDHAASPTLDLWVNNNVRITSVNTLLDATWDSADSGYLQCINRRGAVANDMMPSIISNLMIWNRPLSDSEVTALQQDPFGPIRQESSSFSFFSESLVANQPYIKRIGGVPFMTQSLGRW